MKLTLIIFIQCNFFSGINKYINYTRISWSPPVFISNTIYQIDIYCYFQSVFIILKQIRKIDICPYHYLIMLSTQPKLYPKRQPSKINIAYHTGTFDLSNAQQLQSTISIFQDLSLTQILSHLRTISNIYTKGKTQAWRIEVQSQDSTNHLPRSKTAQQFCYHTDHSFTKYPPSNILLYCEHPDKMGGGVSKIISLSTLLQLLDAQAKQLLRQPVYDFMTPPQFIESLTQQQNQKLPILFEENGSTSIRYRYDIINKKGLAPQNLAALELLEHNICLIKPVHLALQQNQSILINNQKYLHARTKIKDTNRLLYRIMFDFATPITGEVYHDFKPSKSAESILQKRIADAKKQFKMQSLPYTDEMFHCDTIEFSHSFNRLQRLQRSFYNFFKAVVYLYTQNGHMAQYLRKVLDWPDSINQIIYKLNEVREFQPEFYRPDFIIQEEENSSESRIKVCEVNCRFATNAFIISLLVNEMACMESQQKYLAPHYSFVADVIKQSFKDQNIYFITNLTKLWDPILLSSAMKQKYGKQIIFITPQELRVVNSELIYYKYEQPINNVILELSQEEIISLPNDILNCLSFNTKCINDIRSIFICHDKRLLALIHQTQFSEYIKINYLQSTEIDILRQHTAKSWNSSNVNMISDLYSSKQKFVLKSPHEGKSKNMLVGKFSSQSDWKTYIETRTHYIVQQYIEPKKLTIYDHSIRKLQNCTTVSTFMCFKNQFWGIGMFRCGNGSSICLSKNGVFLPSRIVSKIEYDPNRYCLAQKIKMVGNQIIPAEKVKQLAQQKYKNLQTKDVRMYKNDVRQMTPNWKSKYISPSGGTTLSGIYVANNLDDNHYMRILLARQCQKYGILDDQDICLNFYAGKYLYRSKQIFNQLCELCGATPLPMDNDFKNQDAEELLKKFQVNVIMGAPSVILRYANFHLNDPIENINKILYSAEYLYEGQKNILATAFPNAKFYSFFGSAQTGVWAYSFGGMQDHFIYKYLSEIVKIEIDEPNTEGVGKLLVTNLLRTETPIYRFQMGDHGMVINNNTFKLVPRPQLTSFRLDSCDFETEEIHEAMQRCLNWQIILKTNKNGIMEVRLLLPEQNRKEAQSKVKENFLKMVEAETEKQAVGRDIQIKFMLVESQNQMIKVFPSGKHYYVIDQRK